MCILFYFISFNFILDVYKSAINAKIIILFQHLFYNIAHVRMA